MVKSKFNRTYLFSAMVVCSHLFRGDEGDEYTPPTKEEWEKAQKAIKDSTDSISKLEGKRTELLDSVNKLKEQTKSFEGLDPVAVKNMLKQFENDEEAKLIAEGKVDEVIKKRTETVQAELGGKLEATVKERDTFKTKAEQLEASIQDMKIDSNITTEFIKAKGFETGIDDAKVRAKKVWKFEEGKLVPRGEDGEIIKGENGVLTPTEWINGLKETAPHLFPDSQGGGSGGNRGSGGGNSIDDQLSKARQKGDIAEMRRLRAKKKAGKD